VSAISADDLASVAANIQSTTFRSFEIYITVTILYFLLSLSFMGLFRLAWLRLLDYPEGR